MRLDKWLWAARFFKTRALAVKSCDMGRVECNGQAAKPSRELKAGDRLQVKIEVGVFDVEVLLLSETRGPSAQAQMMYRELEEGRAARLKAVDERKSMLQAGAPEARPSKRDRRDINKLRGRG